MKKIPGTLQAGRATFPPTQWSVVVGVGRETGDGAQTQAALDQLCRDYWPPLYNYVRRRGHGSQDAQDLVQGFFASLLENQSYQRADPAKGKFRAFLLGALKNYLADEHDGDG